MKKYWIVARKNDYKAKDTYAAAEELAKRYVASDHSAEYIIMGAEATVASPVPDAIVTPILA